MAAGKTARKSPWAVTRDRDAEREEKMEAILLAAAEAFSENGYNRTSIENITERLGITKPTLYHYCAGKEDLIMRVSIRGLDRIVDAEALDAHSSGLDQLRQTLRRYIEWVATDFGKSMVSLRESDLSQPNAAKVREWKRAIDHQVRALISKGIADRTIGPCDPRLTAYMLASAINGIALWYKKGSEPDPRALAEIYVNQMTSGLKLRTP